MDRGAVGEQRGNAARRWLGRVLWVLGGAFAATGVGWILATASAVAETGAHDPVPDLVHSLETHATHEVKAVVHVVTVRTAHVSHQVHRTVTGTARVVDRTVRTATATVRELPVVGDVVRRVVPSTDPADPTPDAPSTGPATPVAAAKHAHAERPRAVALPRRAATGHVARPAPPRAHTLAHKGFVVVPASTNDAPRATALPHHQAGHAPSAPWQPPAPVAPEQGASGHCAYAHATAGPEWTVDGRGSSRLLPADRSGRSRPGARPGNTPD